MHATTHAGPRNRLAAETSPYLLQHAGNPVEWHPWGDEAIASARALDRPILLSIGYSACHWCHVMAHESFEDPATAALMNRLFVNVKVDREERPDLDKVYQLAHQLLTQRPGGWPLTMFLDPEDLTPFFGGTYFPRERRYGMPAFGEILERVAAFHRDERSSVRAQNASLRSVFGEIAPPIASAGQTITAEPLAQRRELEQAFDDRFGGFGAAPKFPHAPAIEFLLRRGSASTAGRSVDPGALHMATFTLRRMAEGGLFDQLGGGFCRYSVDPYWMIPHFEKMLYDNGPLLALCAEAGAATGDGVLRRAASETAAWALREMRSREGAFLSALDADSEGHEGRFYAWRREDVQALLTPDEYRVFARRFGLDREPNFEGAYHLHGFVEPARVAGESGIALPELEALLESARGKLFAAREERVRPGLDDKVLTAWNALMIRGLAVAGRLQGERAWIDAAARAVDFLRAECWRDGRLYATWKEGAARHPAYLDDYAFLLDALLECLATRFRAEDLRFAGELAGALLDRFADRQHGGFWFTAAGHETPLHRPKSYADEAMASGNAAATRSLARLGWLTGETTYLDAAEAAIRGAWPSLVRSPQAHASMLVALEEWLDPPEIVVIRGNADGVADWGSRLGRRYAPRQLVLAIPAGVQDLPDALASKRAGESPRAWVCKGPTCSEPVSDLGALIPR